MEQILQFNDRQELHEWLQANHREQKSIWIKFNKMDKSGLKPAEVLEEILCFGWIDSTVKRVDETYYIKKIAKRRKKSNWSEYNKSLVGNLIRQGKVQEAGLEAIRAAKKDGMWDKPDNLPLMTEEMLAELRRQLENRGLPIEKFDKLAPSVKKNYGFYYFSAKMEKTRENRLLRIIDSIENGPFLI